MHIIVVHIHVKPEHREAFIEATKENARNSIQEPGIAVFDFIQQKDDPNKFVLYEAYYSPDGQAQHRETAHYLAWRDAVADMMAEPRVGVAYSNILPADDDWR